MFALGLSMVLFRIGITIYKINIYCSLCPLLSNNFLSAVLTLQRAPCSVTSAPM